MNSLSYLKDREPSKSYKNFFRRGRNHVFEGTSSVLSNFRQFFRTSMDKPGHDSQKMSLE
jgi:hypothetical protein